MINTQWWLIITKLYKSKIEWTLFDNEIKRVLCLQIKYPLSPRESWPSLSLDTASLPGFQTIPSWRWRIPPSISSGSAAEHQDKFYFITQHREWFKPNPAKYTSRSEKMTSVSRVTPFKSWKISPVSWILSEISPTLNAWPWDDFLRDTDPGGCLRRGTKFNGQLSTCAYRNTSRMTNSLRSGVWMDSRNATRRSSLTGFIYTSDYTIATQKK